MRQHHIHSLIGTVIQDRYIIEGVLGKGGFSTVYLVKDQYIADKPTTGSTNDRPATPQKEVFALKVLTEQDERERNRFLFEHVILEWLDHPALPRVYRVFEDDEHTYLLMDYIAGTTLEKLRQQQAEKRCSLEQVLTMLAPVVDAIIYLHQQQSPIIHRDIKPSNIIISQTDGKAILVDFGIAKEYDPDATITAIRHCSAGYSAPEQYSSMRTDQRTDVYSLAATCYTLLAGIVPIDALRRLTSLASKGSDPLVALNMYVPTLPAEITAAIHRAMAIDSDDRFTTVQEFWQALHTTQKLQDQESPVMGIPIAQPHDEQVLPPYKTHSGRPRAAILVHTLLTLFLLIGFGVWTYTINQYRSQPATPLTATSVQHQQLAPAIAAPSNLYSQLATSYKGSIHSISANATTPMTLSQVQQDKQNIQGIFKGMNRSDSFIGVLDISKHIFFTVGNTGSEPLFFQGAVRADGNLVGTYCTLDSAGQCTGAYGIWSVAP